MLPIVGLAVVQGIGIGLARFRIDRQVDGEAAALLDVFRMSVWASKAHTASSSRALHGIGRGRIRLILSAPSLSTVLCHHLMAMHEILESPFAPEFHS